MAARERPLSVIRSPIANDEIHAIWLWNALNFSPAHADAYVRYVEQCIDDLGHRYSSGKTVHVRPNLRFIVMRRKASGHGHIAVYRVNGQDVEVLHVFHTAQGWPAILADEAAD